MVRQTFFWWGRKEESELEKYSEKRSKQILKYQDKVYEGQKPDKDLTKDFELIGHEYFSKINISLKLRVQNYLRVQNT